MSERGERVIFVDELFDWPGKGRWCHMVTDGDLEELHQFAEKIGMKRAWFQNHPRHPHYDLRAGTRTKAIRAGAQILTRREFGLMMAKREGLIKGGDNA
jgi:hypothetical protein